MNEQLLKMSGTDVYPLGKNSENPYGGGIHPPPPPHLVRPRVNILNVGYSQAHDVKVSSWELFQNMGREVNDNDHYSKLCCQFLQTCRGCKKTKLHWFHTQPRLKANYTCKGHFQIYTISSSKFTAGATLSQH